MSFQRPAFWRLPRNNDNNKFAIRKKVHFDDQVQIGSPAHNVILRGDMVTKIEDYDSRDLRHEDAQMLFKNAGNSINVVVHRDNKIAHNQNLSNGSSRCASTIPAYSPTNILSPTPQNDMPHRAPSPLPQLGSYHAAMSSPVNSLPHTVFPYVNESGGYNPPSRPPSCFSPMPTRDYQHEIEEETAAITNQVSNFFFLLNPIYTFTRKEFTFI